MIGTAEALTTGKVVLVPGIALAISIALGFLLRSRALRELFLDQPNQRSLHRAPVPRSGGLAIHAAFGGAALLLALGSTLLPGMLFWFSWLLVVAVSTWDDLGHAPVGMRLAVHLAAACLLAAELGLVPWPMPWAAAVPALAVVLALVWFMNLFNFMDGMDGLAGLMALTGSVSLAVAGLLQHDPAYATLAAVVAAAVAGFLVHNWPPARLFMGDAGSVGLGFLLGALGLYGMTRGLFSGLVPLLIFLPFVADATYTLASRIVRGQRPWEAHREHIYQRLVLAGWPVRKVLVIEFLIMLVCQAVALLIVAMRSSS